MVIIMLFKWTLNDDTDAESDALKNKYAPIYEKG